MCGEYMYRITIARLWTGAILYGIYVMVFTGSIYVILKQRSNKLILAGSVVLFILTTAITILSFLDSLLSPLATSMSTFTDGATVPCNHVQVKIHETAVGSLLMVLTYACKPPMFIIADGVLIFRCAILWGASRWIVALPSFLLLVSTVCNLAPVYYYARICVQTYRGISMLSAPSMAMTIAATRFSDAANSLSLATNVLTSFLVVLKIWRMTKGIERVLGKKAGLRYRAIIAMFVESGALFSASLAAELAMTFSSAPAEISETIVAYVMAITPTLIIVRVGMGAGFDNVHETFGFSNTSNTTHATTRRDRPTTTLSAIRFVSVQETSVVNSESSAGEYGLEKALGG